MPDKYMTVKCVCGGTAVLTKVEEGFLFRCVFDPGLATPAVYTSPGRAAQGWNHRQQKMDNCDRQAICAYHRGQSYGKYVAGIPTPPPVERFPKGQRSDDREPHCENCGMLIPAGGRSKKYCSATCAEEARRKRKTNQSDKVEPAPPPQPKPKRLCIRCGKPLSPNDLRRKYCSADCADQARLDLMREKYHLKKNSK